MMHAAGTAGRAAGKLGRTVVNAAGTAAAAAGAAGGFASAFTGSSHSSESNSRNEENNNNYEAVMTATEKKASSTLKEYVRVNTLHLQAAGRRILKVRDSMARANARRLLRKRRYLPVLIFPRQTLTRDVVIKTATPWSTTSLHGRSIICRKILMHLQDNLNSVSDVPAQDCSGSRHIK